MLDIETLDTQPSALVLSAGWAWFNENRVISSGVVQLRPPPAAAQRAHDVD
jgi:hypothetical protein